MTLRSRLAGWMVCCLNCLHCLSLPRLSRLPRRLRLLRLLRVPHRPARLPSPTRMPSSGCFPAPRRIAALIPMAMAAAITLPAAAVHRCESGGKVSYSDLPCAGASTLTIDDAPPSVRAATAADPHQQRQAAELARLQQLRELRERQDQRIRDLAARGAAAREKKCRTLAMQLKWRDEDLREASLKQEANARKRLRRAEERYREECR